MDDLFGYAVNGAAPELEHFIGQMVTHKKRIFPNSRESCRDSSNPHDHERFVVALRHGCLGIASSLRYLAGKPSAQGMPFDRGMVWGALLFDLKALFDLLVEQFNSESRRTQYYIRDFLFQLQNTYAILLCGDAGEDHEDIGWLGIVYAKIAVMVSQIRQTLSGPSP